MQISQQLVYKIRYNFPEILSGSIFNKFYFPKFSDKLMCRNAQTRVLRVSNFNSTNCALNNWPNGNNGNGNGNGYSLYNKLYIYLPARLSLVRVGELIWFNQLEKISKRFNILF
jgi:hypothetical protein